MQVAMETKRTLSVTAVTRFELVVQTLESVSEIALGPVVASDPPATHVSFSVTQRYLSDIGKTENTTFSLHLLSLIHI